MPVNTAHLHLLLNHVPTVGSVVALGLLLLALVRRDEALKHAGLEVLFAIAVLTLPVYTSGVAAFMEIRNRPEISDQAMRIHQDAALAGFVATELAGFLAWVALWQTRRRGGTAPGVVPATIVMLVLALAITGRAANLGGDIRHPEIRPDLQASETAAGTDQYVAGSISRVMVNSTWVWPLSETIHFLGLSLSFGVLLAVNLRILGVMKQFAFTDVHRLLPWGMLGFGVNLITGMLFFVGQPGQYSASSPFFWKVVFLMIAGANFLYLTVARHLWVDSGLDSSPADKAMAASSIAAWLAVLYAGRMLPFIGDAF
jgi:uncharacterized membrane protein YGL010W